jgi:hydroxymethylbilane synthase
MAAAALRRLRIGTRGSALAMWQAQRVGRAVERGGDGHVSAPGTSGERGRSFVTTEIVVVKTAGDKFVTAGIEQIGVQGVFTKELEEALFSDRADIAVHSMKDVPTEFSDQCRLVAVFKRDDPRDALVARGGAGQRLADLPRGAKIGTSSLRRASQLRKFRVDFEIVEIRGNVDTRVRKVEEGECDAVVLAKAGLERLRLDGRISEVLEADVMLPAVGQGVLAVEYFEPRGEQVRPVIEPLVDRETMLAVTAERALSAELQGGCRVPFGAWARFEGGELVMDARVLSADGSECVGRSAREACGSATKAGAIGRRLAKELIEAGAGRILKMAGRSVGKA